MPEFPTAPKGPIPFPVLDDGKESLIREIAHRQAEVEAVRGMAALGGSAEWPNIRRVLSGHVGALTTRLIAEKDPGEIPRLQAHIIAFQTIVDMPANAEKRVADLAKVIEQLKARLAK